MTCCLDRCALNNFLCLSIGLVLCQTPSLMPSSVCFVTVSLWTYFWNRNQAFLGDTLSLINKTVWNWYLNTKAMLDIFKIWLSWSQCVSCWNSVVAFSPKNDSSRIYFPFLDSYCFVHFTTWMLKLFFHTEWLTYQYFFKCLCKHLYICAPSSLFA